MLSDTDKEIRVVLVVLGQSRICSDSRREDRWMESIYD